MIQEINKYWNWKGFKAKEILRTNEFGNIIFKTDNNEFWRLCPEEISCEKIADNEREYHKIVNGPEFIEDWEMTNLLNVAKTELGELKTSEKYCLKMSAVIGGKYEESNIGKINFSKLIEFSGDFGYQIKDFKDGQKIEFRVENNSK